MIALDAASFPRPPAVDHEPQKEILLGSALIGVFLFGFIGWSAVARLDAAVHVPGVVRVVGSRQVVQSVATGVITAINVHEGDRVAAGQVLVDFASTELVSQERSLASRVIGLQAEIARIATEQAGAVHVPQPAEWTSLTGAERDEAERARATEQANLVARNALMISERAVLGQRLAETADQIDGYRERQSSNRRQGVLNDDELTGVQQLYKKGYATKTRVLALQRSAASIDGDIGSTQAEMARLRSSAGELRLQIMQLADQRDHDNSDRLRTARTELESVLPQWQAAREQLARSAARAPVSGTVLELAANTVGGVTAAGQKLMDIVPDRRSLEIAAQVALADANNLHPGQTAQVTIPALHDRDLKLHGTVRLVSADSLVDEHSGRSFFTATISVPRDEIDRISRDAGITGTVKPGTPVDVVVPLRSRTALQYWLGPLTERLSPALHEW